MKLIVLTWAALFVGVLGLLPAQAAWDSSIAEPLIQAQVAETSIRLFKWGKTCEIIQVYDANDFDTDSRTGDSYFKIIRFEINCLFPREVTFEFTDRLGIKRTTIFAKDTGDFSIPLLVGRTTQESLRWDFTPIHLDVIPGSVSNPALLTSGGANGNVGSFTTAAFTPTADGLMIVAAAHGGAAEPTDTWTSGHTGQGAFTDIEAAQSTRGSSQGYSQTGAAPGSATVTDTWDSNQSRWAWVIAEVTGHNVASPVAESTTNSSVGATLSCTLASVSADNRAVGVVEANINGGVTPGTNETETAEANAGTGTNPITVQLEHSDGGTDTDINWTTLGTSNSCIAIEYAQAAGAAAKVIMID